MFFFSFFLFFSQFQHDFLSSGWFGGCIVKWDHLRYDGAQGNWNNQRLFMQKISVLRITLSLVIENTWKEEHSKDRLSVACLFFCFSIFSELLFFPVFQYIFCLFFSLFFSLFFVFMMCFFLFFHTGSAYIALVNDLFIICSLEMTILILTCLGSVFF